MGVALQSLILSFIASALKSPLLNIGLVLPLYLTHLAPEHDQAHPTFLLALIGQAIQQSCGVIDMVACTQ